MEKLSRPNHDADCGGGKQESADQSAQVGLRVFKNYLVRADQRFEGESRSAIGRMRKYDPKQNCEGAPKDCEWNPNRLPPRPELRSIMYATGFEPTAAPAMPSIWVRPMKVGKLVGGRYLAATKTPPTKPKTAPMPWMVKPNTARCSFPGTSSNAQAPTKAEANGSVNRAPYRSRSAPAMSAEKAYTM